MKDWRAKLNEYWRYPGVVPALSKIAEAMCAPFWWSLKKPGDAQAHILNNGTICYLNTGSHELGITANHVLDNTSGITRSTGMQPSASSAAPRFRPRNGSSTGAMIGPSRHLTFRRFSYPRHISLEELSIVQRAGLFNGLRLGTLSSTAAFQESFGRNEVVLLIFPFTFQWMMGGVCDVSGKNIVMEPDFKTINWINPEPGKEFNADVRGMSGGPIFRVVDGIIRLELAGFIYEFTHLAKRSSDDRRMPLLRTAQSATCDKRRSESRSRPTGRTRVGDCT